MKEIIHENLYKVLEEYAKEVIAEYREKLRANNKNASGSLDKSLNYHIVEEGNDIVVYLDIAEHWYYVEKGRGPTHGGNKGGPTVHEKIRDWIVVKGIVPDNPKGLPTEKALDSFAWAITKKIHKEGYKSLPGNYLQDTIQQLYIKYEPMISEAMEVDSSEWILQNVDDLLDNLLKK